MNVEKIKQWVKELRSGDYKQGRYDLVRIDSNGTKFFCPHGVACHLFAEELGLTIDEKPAGFNGHVLQYDSQRHFPPFAVRNYLGLNLFQVDHLAMLNDNGSSFDKIADEIERWI